MVKKYIKKVSEEKHGIVKKESEHGNTKIQSF